MYDPDEMYVGSGSNADSDAIYDSEFTLSDDDDEEL
jgi:hypothetical protein